MWMVKSNNFVVCMNRFIVPQIVTQFDSNRLSIRSPIFSDFRNVILAETEKVSEDHE